MLCTYACIFVPVLISFATFSAESDPVPEVVENGTPGETTQPTQETPIFYEQPAQPMRLVSW